MERKETPAWPGVIAALSLVLLFLSPWIWAWTLALDPVMHPSGSDWVRNHDANVLLAQLTLAILGAPTAGAVLGAGAAASRRRSTGSRSTGKGALTGACLASLLLSVGGLVWFFANFRLGPEQ
ncbi:hypothetical protein [Streptomyces sp. NPDC017529]|uniref:hypothetical protein n=1 Tax=Streptomyces sp. NPDC017529 TaxID=3365000 RepID=UPI0037AB8883